MRSCIMHGLPTHFVQELNIGTVEHKRKSVGVGEIFRYTQLYIALYRACPRDTYRNQIADYRCFLAKIESAALLSLLLSITGALNAP